MGVAAYRGSPPHERPTGANQTEVVTAARPVDYLTIGGAAGAVILLGVAGAILYTCRLSTDAARGSRGRASDDGIEMNSWVESVGAGGTTDTDALLVDHEHPFPRAMTAATETACTTRGCGAMPPEPWNIQIVHDNGTQVHEVVMSHEQCTDEMVTAADDTACQRAA